MEAKIQAHLRAFLANPDNPIEPLVAECALAAKKHKFEWKWVERILLEPLLSEEINQPHRVIQCIVQLVARLSSLDSQTLNLTGRVLNELLRHTDETSKEICDYLLSTGLKPITRGTCLDNVLGLALAVIQSKWLHVLVDYGVWRIMCVGLLASSSLKTRTMAGMQLLPLLIEGTHFEERLQFWNLFTQLKFRSIDNDVLCSMTGSLCQMFDFWMGLVHGKQLPSGPLLDLRADETVMALIQEGLISRDSNWQKYARHLLKRIIHFSTHFDPLSKPHHGKFYWPNKSSSVAFKTVKDSWDSFLILWDALDDPHVHLVEPHVSTLMAFAHTCDFETGMHPSWWTLLIEHALQNPNTPVHKLILDAIFQLDLDNASLDLLTRDFDFLFESVFTRLEDPSLFTTNRGTYVVPFGDAVSSLIVKTLNQSRDPARQGDFIRRMLHLISKQVNRIAILYMLQGLSFYAAQKDGSKCILGSDHVVWMTVLLGDSAHSLSTLRTLPTRTLMASWCIQIIGSFVDVDQVPFMILAEFISVSIGDASLPSLILAPMTTLIHSINEQKPGWLIDNLNHYLSAYLMLSTHASNEHEPLITSEDCPKHLSALLVVLSHLPHSGLDQVLEPLRTRLTQLKSGQAQVLDRTLLALKWFRERFDAGPSLYAPDKMDLKIPSTSLDEAAFLLHRRMMNSKDFAETKLNHEIFEPLLIKYRPCVRNLKVITSMLHDDVRLLLTQNPNTLVLFGCVLSLGTTHRAALYSSPNHTTSIPLSQLHQLLDRIKHLKLKKEIHQHSDAHQNWNEIQTRFDVARYDLMGWVIVDILERTEYRVTPTIQCCFKFNVEQLEDATEVTAVTIFNNLLNFLCYEEMELDPGYIEQSLKKGLELLDVSWRSKTFHGLLEEFSGYAFGAHMLRQPWALQVSQNPVLESIKRVLELSKARKGLLDSPHKAMFEFWDNFIAKNGFTPLSYQSLLVFQDVFCDFLSHGLGRDINSTEMKQEGLIAFKIAQVNAKDDLEDAQGTAAVGYHSNEYLVRARSNDFLLRLNENDGNHVNFAMVLMDNLLVRHSKASKDPLGKFPNSTIQKISTRMWCSIVILSHFIPGSKAESMIKKMLVALEGEGLAEVRFYIEWTLILTLLKHPKNLHLFWARMEDLKIRPANTTSLLCIALHLSKSMPSVHQAKFFAKLFEVLLPWSSSNHHNVRSMAQYNILKAWKLCSYVPHLNDLMNSLPHVSKMVQFFESSNDCQKHLKKCDAKYVIGGGFDPLKDLNLEFLFRGSFDLFDMEDDEKLSSAIFCKFPKHQDYFMPTGYKERISIKTRLSLVLEMERQESSPIPLQNQDASTLGSVQKKILPWEGLDTELEFLSGFARQSSVKQVKRQPLIVCASLISLAPNLGGLCRSCEIFNAELLVLNNIKVAEDPSFVATSVSASPWMPLKEVKEDDLECYLKEVKSQGYTLVGVEQATNSVPLQQYAFPKKTLLLLGNEKVGIPVRLFGLLDTIIEIPQLGLIRSLNVHVSGALLIWEYSKQHSLPTSTRS